jgi:hypothetical protein
MCAGRGTRTRRHCCAVGAGAALARWSGPTSPPLRYQGEVVNAARTRDPGDVMTLRGLDASVTGGPQSSTVDLVTGLTLDGSVDSLIDLRDTMNGAGAGVTATRPRADYPAGRHLYPGAGEPTRVALMCRAGLSDAGAAAVATGEGWGRIARRRMRAPSFPCCPHAPGGLILATLQAVSFAHRMFSRPSCAGQAYMGCVVCRGVPSPDAAGEGALGVQGRRQRGEYDHADHTAR